MGERFYRRDFASGTLGLVLWGVVLAMTLAFAAVDILPVNAAQPSTLVTSVIPLRLISRYHVRVIHVFQLLHPFALGSPTGYFGPDNYWETVFSIGLVPLFLMLVGGRWHPDRHLAGAGGGWFYCRRRSRRAERWGSSRSPMRSFLGWIGSGFRDALSSSRRWGHVFWWEWASM